MDNLATRGDILQRLREEQNLSQKELGELVNMTAQQISERERGRVRISPAEERLFARAFSISTDEMHRRLEATLGNLRTAEHPGIPIINKAPAGPAWDFEHYGVSTRDGTDYMAREEGEQSDDLFAVVVFGDSMEPLLLEGDRVVLWPVPKVEGGLPPKLLHDKICYLHFREEEGGGSCLGKIELTGDSDPARGLEAKLVKLNRAHKGRTFYLTDLDQLAIATRLSRKLWSM